LIRFERPSMAAQRSPGVHPMRLPRFRLRTLMIAVAVAGAVLATIVWAIDSSDGDIPRLIACVWVLMNWCFVLLVCLVMRFFIEFHRFRVERHRLRRTASERPACVSPGSRQGG